MNSVETRIRSCGVSAWKSSQMSACVASGSVRELCSSSQCTMRSLASVVTRLGVPFCRPPRRPRPSFFCRAIL